MIEIFNDIYDATYFIENLAIEAQSKASYCRIELLLLADGRWRVGVLDEQQLELPFDKFKGD